MNHEEAKTHFAKKAMEVKSKFERHMIHEQAKAHLIDKVREQVKRLEARIPDLINHLDISGSGIVDDHIVSLSKGRIYETTNKVQLAVLEHFVESSRPPRSLNTKGFRDYVRNLINLL